MPERIEKLAREAKKNAIAKGHTMTKFVWWGENVPEMKLNWKRGEAVCITCGARLYVTSFEKEATGRALRRVCSRK